MSRSFWAWARLLGGAAIIALVLWRLGTGAFLDGLRVLDGGTLALAFGIGVVTTVLSAWRWCLVARGLGMRLSLKDATADYYQALFLNAALPGGVLGDVGRAVSHGREEGDVGRGVRAVVLERTAGQIVLVVVGGAVLISVPSPVLTLISENGRAIAMVAAVAAMAALLVLGIARRVRQSGSKLAGAARTGAAEIRSGLLARRNWPGVLFASAMVLIGHLATFIVAARVAGNGASFLTLAPMLLLALLAMGIPLNVGGWGPREGVMAWAFGAAGLSAEQGVTIAVAYGICAFVAAAPGAIVVAVRAAKKMRRPVLTPVAVQAEQPDFRVRVTAPVSPAVVVNSAAPIPVPIRRTAVRRPAYSSSGATA
ncbi:lysylphosphatidylglycerol synthase transmembrane domain-containing protein [Actinoplanes sp. NPDC020271]|uniref:lysylphosphatidylglycerol synthase transmembrane domain-containing protein n=1 Tax=Actinoplanes sp. NPDC020271 TaxID=3363896 RepID=UPI0037A6E21A